MQSERLITPAAAEPITLADAKLHLRVDIDDDNALITGMLAAAREACETWSARAFLDQTWRLTLDAFPTGSRLPPGPETAWSGRFKAGGIIELPRPPLKSVTSITYVDADGTTQTLSPGDYQVDTDSEPGRIMPAYGKSWPATRDQMAAVRVLYSVGYGTAAANTLPACAKPAILQMLATLYENRGEAGVGGMGAKLPIGAMDLLESIRIRNLA